MGGDSVSLTKQDLADIQRLITDALKPIETRLGNVETRLGNVETDIVAIRDRLGNLEAGVKAIRDHFGIDDEMANIAKVRAARVRASQSSGDESLPRAAKSG